MALSKMRIRMIQPRLVDGVHRQIGDVFERYELHAKILIAGRYAVAEPVEEAPAAETEEGEADEE
jgi:hypothetical protein